MSAGGKLVRRGAAALLLGHLVMSADGAWAQDTQSFPPPGWRARHVEVRGHQPTSHRVRDAAVSRGLTINRRPQEPDTDPDDVFDDGVTRYNAVRSFNPAPAVTSGVQLPFGLDGVGGYGSDLGFEGGQDSALYQRGP